MSRIPKSARCSSIFAGYPAGLIARWCMVKEKTVRDWLTGRKRPSKRCVRLFQLHARGQVLGPSWRDWRINGDTLYDAGGKPFKRTDMEMHVIVYQIASHCRRHHVPGKPLWEIMRQRSP